MQSQNIDKCLRIRIACLEGERPEPDLDKLLENPHLVYHNNSDEQKTCADLQLECILISDTLKLCPPMQTPYKHFSEEWNWNEWIEFPIAICDLPKDTILAITIYDSLGPSTMEIIGKAFVNVFGPEATMRVGVYDLKVWMADEIEKVCEPDCNIAISSLTGQTDLDRLYELTSHYHTGRIGKIAWLDKLTFNQIEKITQKAKLESGNMYLSVEFPKVYGHKNTVDIPIVYFEHPQNHNFVDKESNQINDPELFHDNIIEGKHHRLSRSARCCISDTDLKPNSEVRDHLSMIVSYPPTKTLSSEEQDLVWKFRYYLMNQKKALTKFLRCLNWQASAEVKIALEMMNNWQPMDTQDALELLTPQFSHPQVRRYAVRRLGEASDEDLLLYLLQLVQAIKYELKSIVADINEPSTPTRDLTSFLIDRCSKNTVLGNYFFWYLIVEIENFSQSVEGINFTASAFKNYTHIMDRFIRALTPENEQIMNDQRIFVDRLVNLMGVIGQDGKNRLCKIERLIELLSFPEEAGYDFKNIDPPLTLPLDPKIMIRGIVAEKATLFKSQLMPAKLTFKTLTSYNGSHEYNVIFKHGDDLRQDQLILQNIILMDKLLRRDNLDLKLTPYRVLATSTRHGFVQFVESESLADIRANEGSIQNFFRKHAPCPDSPYGIQPEVMESYIRSCAGYCVITYLLGVGDRHLDNLLLTKTGKLFHIDFGYILGRDPKPMPPPMKLTREMVEAMGGTSSELYTKFLNLSHTAFLHLRRHSNLILNLFALMVDANVPDIAVEPDKTVKKVQDKFRLDLSDEEAVHYIQQLIEISVNDVMAAFVEQIHKIAQYWRK